MDRVKLILNEFAAKNGVLIGICNADKIDVSLQHTDTPFVSEDTELRTNPKFFFKEAQSIIVFGLPYEDAITVNIEENKLYGKLALGTSGLDYHLRLQKIMSECVASIETIQPIKYKYHIDTSPLIEREFARKAGLGFIGKNSMLINESFGSYFNIGLLLVDIVIESSVPKTYQFCDNCNLCEKACIGGAISSNGKFNYSRCVSYLTQKKESLTEQEAKFLNGFIYGCDICQKVCPLNQKIKLQNHFISIDEFLELSNKQFKDTYGKTSIAWRGKKVLQRNAEIIKYVEYKRS